MSEQGMEQTQYPGRPSGVEGFTSADVSDVAQMSYEQARAELVETVGRLETGGAGLEAVSYTHLTLPTIPLV